MPGPGGWGGAEVLPGARVRREHGGAGLGGARGGCNGMEEHLMFGFGRYLGPSLRNDRKDKSIEFEDTYLQYLHNAENK